MCSKCEPYAGLWQRTDAGLIRCDCAPNQTLRKVEQARHDNIVEKPVLSDAAALAIVEMLSGLLAYFPAPTQAIARGAIASEIQKICASETHAEWLVSRMAKLYTQWPGVRDMRMVYCSKYRPLDGFELAGGTEDYPDGIPSEADSVMGALPAGHPQRALPAPRGEQVSAAESIRETVAMLAEAKSMKYPQRHVNVPDIPILPPGDRISQTDIDAAVNTNRERIAREELGL